MIAGQYHAISLGIKGSGILLKTVEPGDPRLAKLLHLVLISILIEAHQVQNEGHTQAMKPPGGGKQLVHALLTHDPPQVQKAQRFIFGVRRKRIFVKINTSAGQHRYAGRSHDPPLHKRLCIGIIFKQYMPRPLQRDFIQHRCQHGKALLLKRRAQPLDIGAVRHPCHAAGKTAVNIGLDGIGDHQIRLLPAQQLPVKSQ